jgi:hypothetical protein
MTVQVTASKVNPKPNILNNFSFISGIKSKKRINNDPTLFSQKYFS